MNELILQLAGNRRAYMPGEELVGVAGWRLDDRAERIEVRLCWYTTGKGTRDVGVVKTAFVQSPPVMGQREFRFALPTAPYSFSGKLICLTWMIEIVVFPGEQAQGREFVMSPSGAEIELGTVAG